MNYCRSMAICLKSLGEEVRGVRVISAKRLGELKQVVTEFQTSEHINGV